MLAGKVRRALRRRRLASGTPALTVVIPVYNVEAYLPACLDSVLGQSLEELEVIAVDDGSTDGCPAILRARARRDPRLVVLTQENAGQGAARNLAVARARGEFLTFCDSDDTIPPRAYARMVEVLRETGSDFVVGAARRFDGERGPGIAFRDAHLVDRFRTTIEESPVAMQDILACNRVYRTAFWVKRIPPYRGRIAYEDHVPGLAAYIRADRFDLLADVTYNWRIRETSTGQQKAVLQNLLDRVEVKEEASEMLRAEASEAVYDIWVTRCLSVDFPPFLAHAAYGDDSYREVLSAAYRTFFDRATAAALTAVPHRHKLRGWLCAEGRWPDLAEAEEHFRNRGQLPLTEVRDGTVYAVSDEPAGFHHDLPEALWEMSEAETPLISAIRSVGSASPDTLLITGYAAIRTLDCSREVPRLEAWLSDPDGAAAVPLTVEQFRDPWANVWTQHRNAGYDNAAFRAVVDVAALPAGTPTWVLHVRVTQQGVVREGSVHAAVEGSQAHHLAAHRFGDLRVTPERSGELGFLLRLDREPEALPPAEPVGPSITDVALTPDDIVLSVGGQGADATSGLAVAKRPVEDRLRIEIPGPGYTVAAPLLERLPVSVVDDDVRATLLVRRSGDPVLRLEPPLSDEERTVFGQARLQRSFRSGLLLDESLKASDAVLFQCGRGEPSDPGQLAIDRRLAATRPDVARFWAVHGTGVGVPDGASPVLVGSRRWYAVLASVRRVCTAVDLDPFFVKQPHQRVLQTFDDVAVEERGITWWRSQSYGEDRIRIEVERRNRDWDAVLVRTDADAELCRREFDYRGEILVADADLTPVIEGFFVD